MIYLDLVTQAYRQRGVIKRPGAGLSPSEKTEALLYLNNLIDEWQALARYSWNASFTVYTITPNHSPILIGPGLASPDFATPNGIPRPTKIVGADLILNISSPATDLPLRIRDDAWWLSQRVKALTSTVPTDLYYSPDTPSGSIFLWPIPTVAYGLRIEAMVTLGAVASLTSTVALPVAYAKALRLTFAEEIPTDIPMPAWLPSAAKQSRAAVQSNNISSPRIASADIGTGAGRGRGFNYQSGGPA